MINKMNTTSQIFAQIDHDMAHQGFGLPNVTGVTEHAHCTIDGEKAVSLKVGKYEARIPVISRFDNPRYTNYVVVVWTPNSGVRHVKINGMTMKQAVTKIDRYIRCMAREELATAVRNDNANVFTLAPQKDYRRLVDRSIPYKDMFNCVMERIGEILLEKRN